LCHSSSSPVPEVLSFDFSDSCEEPMGGAGQRLGVKDRVVSGGNADFDSFFDYGNMGMEGGQDSFFNL
jgi:hypothetical protein